MTETTHTESGYDRLHRWFGLSYASFMTVPRVLMQQMPDEWQGKMAALLEEYEETFPNQPDISCQVSFRQGNRYVKAPGYLLNYRRPDMTAINAMRGSVKGASDE